MAEPESVRAAEELYEAELAARGVGDVRPACRQLLIQLKATDPDAYDDGVRRYEDELVPQIAAGHVKALDGWLAYGSWLGDRLYEGRMVSVDESGRSVDFTGELSEGSMAIYLPPRDDQRAVLLASPLTPSEYQAATRDLLCG